VKKTNVNKKIEVVLNLALV